MLNRLILILCLMLSFQVEGQNLISEGDFSNNTFSFSTDLHHIPSCSSGPGTYCITDVGWHPGEATPSDYMMKVDGNLSSTANDILWSKTLYHVDSGNYDLSFQCFPRSASHHIEVDVLIDGIVVGRFLQTTGGWKSFTTNYQVQNPKSSLNIALKQVHFGHYTDWDLDNLCFSKKGSVVLDTIPTIIRPQESPAVISVFPNPMLEDITLEVDSTFFPYIFVLHDLSGELVYIQEGIREKEYHINLSHLPRATFIARIVSEEKIVWKGKLIRY